MFSANDKEPCKGTCDHKKKDQFIPANFCFCSNCTIKGSFDWCGEASAITSFDGKSFPGCPNGKSLLN